MAAVTGQGDATITEGPPAQSLVVQIRGRDWFLLPLGAALLAFILIEKVNKSRGRALNRCLALAGALQWIFGILFVAGALL